jgi:hypothetical protein
LPIPGGDRLAAGRRPGAGRAAESLIAVIRWTLSFLKMV